MTEGGSFVCCNCDALTGNYDIYLLLVKKRTLVIILSNGRAGYKFDETDQDSYALRLSFARHAGPRGPPPRGGDESYRGGRGGRDAEYDRRRPARR